MKRILFTLSISLFFILGKAQDMPSYYASTDGKSGAVLKSALHDIITSHEKIYYGNLWAMYESTDFIEGTKNSAGHYRVFDYYSNNIHYFNGDGTTVSGMDREHAVPQSWWGNDNNLDVRSDLFHVMPSDSKANSAKSNYPLGVVKGTTSFSNPRMKTGKDSTGKMVFEPTDDYKGDFARMYFYIATCYPDIWQTGTNYAMQSEAYPTLKSWIVDMLLQWHRQDPVSEWEMKRQERVARFQHNRNPFIDYPEFAEHIWGNKKTSPFSLSSATLQSLNTDTYQYGSVFYSTFLGDRAGFTTKNVKGSYTVWKNDATYGWKATAYISGSNKAAESWLISHAIELPTEYAVVAFDHALNKGTADDVSLHISTDKTNWTELKVPTWPAGTNWTFLFSGDIDLQDFLGQTVYFGFRYVSTTSNAPTWEVKNFTVFGSGKRTVPTGIEEVKSEKQKVNNDGDVYDMMGRRVISLSPGNIYIKNGKKIIYK